MMSKHIHDKLAMKPLVINDDVNIAINGFKDLQHHFPCRWGSRQHSRETQKTPGLIDRFRKICRDSWTELQNVLPDEKSVLPDERNVLPDEKRGLPVDKSV